jgi:hypothetical protein
VIAAQWQNYQDSRPNLNFKQSLEHTRKRKPAEATHESMKFHSKPKFLIPVGSHRRSFFCRDAWIQKGSNEIKNTKWGEISRNGQYTPPSTDIIIQFKGKGRWVQPP